MADLRLWVDRCDATGIYGWADEEGPVDSINLYINGSFVSSLSPNDYRPDLREAGLGDGRRAFGFSFAGRLGPGLNVVTLKRDPISLFETTVLVLDSMDDTVAHTVSQVRWRGDESPAGLTWGRLMTGDTLWNLYLRFKQFMGNDRLLEIGHGYGRLLNTAIQRNIPFTSYTAVDLSVARIDKLRDEFTVHGVQFVNGDIEYWAGTSAFDVVICSGTFEHLHPDCRRALKNIHRQIADGGTVFIDFICTEKSDAHFEESGTYIRQYPPEELLAIFHECQYVVVSVETCTLAHDDFDPVDRFVVVARKE
jgi:SAM-dependent methyltransferase